MMNRDRVLNYAGWAAVLLCLAWAVGDFSFDYDWPGWFDFGVGMTFFGGLLHRILSYDQKSFEKLHWLKLDQARQKEREQLCVHCGKPWQTKDVGGLEV